MSMVVWGGVGLGPAGVGCINLVKNLYAGLTSPGAAVSLQENNQGYPQARPRVGVFAGSVSIFGVVMAVLLLLPTVHNMYEVAYVHPADGPHEMMVYVQTTTDVNIAMAKVNALDQTMFVGKRQIPIGLTA